MRPVELADMGFLLAERRETPMHVGGVNLYTLPDGVNEQEFLASLNSESPAAQDLRQPFGEYITTRRDGIPGPAYWQLDDHFDLDYHLRHSALPAPGRYRELFALVSRLHSTLLDRSRPLWELHLIEGLASKQLAVYLKMHHAAIDGVGSMQLTQALCSPDPAYRSSEFVLSQRAYERYLRSVKAVHPQADGPKEGELRAVAEALKQTFDSSAHLFNALRRFGGAFFDRSGNLAVPWHNVPRTSINTRVGGARRFVAQSWDFDRVKSVCAALGGTVNDVVLAMCSGALRRYLQAHNELPGHSLKAMVPVSLREAGNYAAGNAVGFITADLATNIAEPQQRLRAIQQSMQAGKELLRGLSAREAAIFMQITQIPSLVTSLLGLSARYPAFSTVISNVPGPRQQLYWNGARLDGVFPASAVFDGFAMNITLVSYNRSLDFGIVACRRSLPQIQRMIDYLEQALVELEEAAGLVALPSRRRGAAARKSGSAPMPHSGNKATSKAKTKTKSKANSEAKSEAKPKARAKAKPMPRPKSQSKSKAKPKSKPRREPQSKSTAKPKARD